MVIVLITLVSVILIIAIYYIIKRIRRNAALRILLRHSQKLTNKTLLQTLNDETQDYQQIFDYKNDLTSDPVQDIWGRGIMVFEYRMLLKADHEDDARLFDQKFLRQFEATLNKHALENGIISSMPKYPPFIISDSWVLTGCFHLDIAFMTNKPTIEYVKDMRKADLEKLN
ncbi:hypothetical protein ACFQ5M_03535 [Agrilactobacillus yilanensis]|uniref:Uncharacterized protein n=1 Tax=Agrilactobacillus yilanensis TaxID=2485997 RepID=A0ABW4J684_9LACO|nr:hypothetical protein [Agrilactobacillus yilanensis]